MYYKICNWYFNKYLISFNNYIEIIKIKNVWHKIKIKFKIILLKPFFINSIEVTTELIYDISTNYIPPYYYTHHVVNKYFLGI